MDRIEKYFRKLRKLESIKLRSILALIMVGSVENLDVQKIIGYNDLYRVRVGDKRIIFQKTDSKYKIMYVGNRKDAYKDL